ncbi:MAG: hypothetical protein QW478_05155 [Candidatus Micrarchaeaceae archaeon]
MGITISWEGETDSRETADKIISYAKFFADSLGWPNEYVKYKSIASDFSGFVYNEPFDEDKAKKIKDYLNSHPTANYHAEEGETEGIIITPPKPFKTESIAILFYPWRGKLRMADFCKTQVFEDENISNLIAHQLIINMLLTIKNTWMPNLEISDEGDYYLPITEKEKEAYIKDHISGEYQEEYRNLKPFNFEKLTEAHGGNLRLINYTADLFKKAIGNNEGLSIETPAKKSFIEDVGKDAENKRRKRLHS